MIASFSALKQYLCRINSPTAIRLLARLNKFLTVYLLLTFRTILSTTEGFHKFFLAENCDLARAVEFKTAVYDAVRGM